MNTFISSGKQFGVIAVLTLSILCPAKSFAVDPCKAQKQALKAATKDENKAAGNARKALGRATSSQNRLDGLTNKASNYATNCAIKVTNTREQMASKLDSMENQRMQYIADIAGVTAQQAGCAIGGIFGGSTEGCLEALQNQITVLTRRITLIEQKIASTRSRGERKIASQETKCSQKNAQNNLLVSRQTTRRDTDLAASQQADQVLLAKTAVRVQKEDLYNQCLAAHP